MNQWMADDPKEAAENAPIVQQLYDAGIDPDELDVSPDGIYTVVRYDRKICFAPSESEEESEPEGWEYTLYVLQFGYWHNSKQDWTRDDDSMVTEVCVGIGHARTSQG